MILSRKFKLAIFGIATFCAAVSSPALTLGRARGGVLLGQALKLTVPIRAEAEEATSALCFEADVFYGDTRQDASRVTVSSDFSPTSQSGYVVITSDARVDEPVVTVYLRAGCQSKTTRRFVVLADPVSETAPATPVQTAKVVRDQPRAISPTTSDGTLPTLDGETPPKSRAKRTVTVRPEPVQTVAVAVQPVAKSTAKRGARLKLAPIDLTVDRDPTLRSSDNLQWTETEDLQKRAEAILLWRSLNASPQDILGADTRRRAMEEDLKNLQTITAKNRQALQDLTMRLEQAESQRYFNPLVYGLLAMLLVCSAGGAYIWLRMRRMGDAAAPWWGADGSHDRVESEDGSAGSAGPAGPSTRSAVAVPPSILTEQEPAQTSMDSGSNNVAIGLSKVDIDLHVDEPVADRSAMVSVPQDVFPKVDPPIEMSRAAGHVDFAHSMNSSLRALNTQEMLDVRQQAEFFMTLGQHEEAIGMLKDSIASSADSNPLIYLDLLRVLHTLGRKIEYDQYRSDFNALFSGRVPTYTEFSVGGDGLEAYPEVCEKIAALWHSDEAVTYIESCLVHTPEGEAAPGFELEAFRDLLMLHGVAMRVASISESGLTPFSTSRTATVDPVPILPAHEEVEAGWLDKTLPIAPAMPSMDGLSVDLDLTEPPGNLIEFDPDELLSFRPDTPRNSG